MAIPRELFNVYRGLTKKEALYIKLRWLVSPIAEIESLLPSKGRIYDIGCGAGLLSNIAAIRSHDRIVTGIDLSEEKIGIAVRSVAGRKNIAFMVSDAIKFPLEKPAAVTICDVLHHMRSVDQEDLLRHIYNLLEKGALLFLQDIDKRPVQKYLFARCVDMILNMGQSVYYRSLGDWVSLLEKIGFKVEAKRLDKGYPVAAILLRCIK